MSLKVLEKQIKKNLLAHAYLFSGDDEEAKENAVEVLLKSALGENFKRSPDFREFAQNPITIEEIRFLKSQAYGKPLVSQKNAFLIRNIENLSREAAPALLKILEEPPESLLIIATTSASDLVLATIKSRLAKLTFSKFKQGKKAQKPKSIEEIREAVYYARDILKKSQSPADILKLEALLKINMALKDPTVNKRLLGEYFDMIMI